MNLLGHQMNSQDDVFQAIILRRSPFLLSESEAFITFRPSLCTCPDSSVPRFMEGFHFSDVFFPISKPACLILITKRIERR